MNKQIFTIALLYCLVIITTAAATDNISVEFDRAKLSVRATSHGLVEYPDCEPVAAGVGLTLAAWTALLPLSSMDKLDDISFESIQSHDVEVTITPEQLADRPTADNSRYANISKAKLDQRLGARAVEVVGEIAIAGQRYAELLIFPVSIDETGSLRFNDQLAISIAGETIPASWLISRESLPATRRAAGRGQSASGQAIYLIVTSEALAETMQELVAYKNETGYATELTTIEAILPMQTGRDDAEKLREHLKTFYAGGGQYLLLAGDEDILPIRYAYPNNAYSQPAMEFLQVCDLYFADLTGDWDVDNDGVWGEKYADRADLVPELLVGRLPINQPEEAANYIAKLIQYETNPGDGDRSYLERAFFFSSDQMRDYGPAGQHGSIAQAYPAAFEIDTVSAVEQATGGDANPTNLSPAELIPAMADGFGIINVIAHGRSDGFILKSSGYNASAKTYVFSDFFASSHAHFSQFSFDTKPALYYSLACDNGGFDMDQPPLNHTTPHMVQDLIGSRGGAVAFVGYTRWGWISSSHLLQKSFFDSLFAHPERPVVEAMYASKAAYYYYRDLVYGLNYFGDPTLKIYTQAPAKPEIRTEIGKDGLIVTVTVDGNPASDCEMILSENGLVLGEFVTSANGDLTISYPFDDLGEYRLTSLLEDAVITQIDYIPALITGVDDELSGDQPLPTSYALYQNYPNPFNPNTSISFDIPIASAVRLAIFNVLGQEVGVLVDDFIASGQHTVVWNSTDSYGQSVASGIYFYRLETEAMTTTKKMILLK